MQRKLLKISEILFAVKCLYNQETKCKLSSFNSVCIKIGPVQILVKSLFQPNPVCQSFRPVSVYHFSLSFSPAILTISFLFLALSASSFVILARFLFTISFFII